MHELSLASEIVTLAQKHLQPGDELRVVHITVGALSGVYPDALDFCFTEITRQLGIDQARLKITRTEARFRCEQCSTEYTAISLEEHCTACQSMARILISGNEFTVDSLDIEAGEHHVR